MSNLRPALKQLTNKHDLTDIIIPTYNNKRGRVNKVVEKWVKENW